MVHRALAYFLQTPPNKTSTNLCRSCVSPIKAKKSKQFWHKHSSRPAFRQSTANDISGHYKQHYFLFSSFSLSSTFLIEGVLGSKNLLSKCVVCMSRIPHYFVLLIFPLSSCPIIYVGIY